MLGGLDWGKRMYTCNRRRAIKLIPVKGSLKGTYCREVGGTGLSRNIGFAGGIHGNSRAAIEVGPSEVGGVD